MAHYYPPVGFHFRVEVDGFGDDAETRFTEVGGLSVELATEEVAEGGENRFVQKFPTRGKYPELVLKRGLLRGSKLVAWVHECVEHLSITPHDVHVTLLDEEHQPLLAWEVVGAFPTKWAASDLSAGKNEIVVDTLQLYYQWLRPVAP